MSPAPDRPSGFFIEHLVPSMLGSGEAPVSALSWWNLARPWASPVLLDESMAARIADEFASGGRIPHVCLRNALVTERAEAVHAALERAEFRPHHHAPYPLHIARPEWQSPSALTELMTWLATPAAARYHLWLAGFGYGKVPDKIQVQTSRMLEGERFPEHVDTEDEGLAVIYNFTAGWQSGEGGTLLFPREDGRTELDVPPLFNSVFLFRTRGVPHRVTPIASPSLRRYSVTAFYLFG